jgi:hypothetical protein
MATKTGFTYVDPPARAPLISSVNPATATAGSTVTISGSNLTDVTAVSFGETAASSFSIVSPTRITAVVGSGSSGNVSVTAPSGAATLPGFNFVPQPGIHANSSLTFTEGGSVVLHASPGSGYNYQWKRNGEDISQANQSSYTASQSGFYVVSITKNAVTATSQGVRVTVNPVPAPTIASISPSTAKAGATVTISGSNFSGATAVRFGGVDATSFTVLSPTSISAVVAEGSSGSVLVSTAAGTASLTGFSYVPVPTISAGGPLTFTTGGSVVLSANPASGYSYQWVKDGTAIPNATNSSYTVTQSGAYAVSIVKNSVITSSDTKVVDVVFALPASNFNVKASSVSCKGASNGALIISAVQPLNYIATITGTTTAYSFTDMLQIDNLAPGAYEVCIKVSGESDYSKCYTTVISEPQDLSVYAAVAHGRNDVTLNLGGAEYYEINLNGTRYTTSKNQITLPLLVGNNKLEVSSDKACQGTVEKSLTLLKDPTVYPNPFERTVSLNLNQENVKKAVINVYGANGKVVYAANYYNVFGDVELDLSDLSSGMYLLKLSTENSDKTIKILKK